VHDVERRLVLMTLGESAAMFSSGMASITKTILTVTKPGSEIISNPTLYGGTYGWFRDQLPKI
jgi:O-acetylhomoserine/O-acetylserine sulfhydrylase-like pyridoxal-dependent enzyme